MNGCCSMHCMASLHGRTLHSSRQLLASDSVSPAPLRTSGPTARFEIRTSGQCAVRITSIAECERASKELNFTDTTAAADWQIKQSTDPSGCYFEGRQLKINVGGTNTGSCSSTDKCLCVKTTASPTLFPTFAPSEKTQLDSSTPTILPTLPPTAAPTQMPTLVPRYELRTAGDCAVYITSIAECEEAARELGLPDTSASDDHMKRSPVSPRGCYGLFTSRGMSKLKVCFFCFFLQC